MEADSEISGNKTIDNKSYLSLNYIYRKVIVKENFENSKRQLRCLNYEKIAKYYMKSMNLKLLLESIFKLKKSLNMNNPLLKYIKDVQPYNFINLNINITPSAPILKEYYKNKNKINLKNKREKILSFAGNKKNFYFSRICNTDYKRAIHNRNEKIILIQKHIRGFLSKKIIDEEVNKIIAKRIIDKILLIQRAVKKFLIRKKSLDKLIVNVIRNERISKSNKITDIFSLFHYRNIYKKNLLIKKILKVRNDSVLLIQNKFRTLIFIKKVKEIIQKEKKSYVLTYPFKAESVQIKIYMKMSYKIYNYFICPVRKYFVLYIDRDSINSGEYLCHLIVNNNIILDKRYKYIVDKKNILYNLISFGQQTDILPIKVNLKKDEKDINKKKKKTKKKKNNEIIDDEEFYFYCYNDNSHSTNSLSTKSDHDKNRINQEIISYKEGNRYKINDFLYQNKKIEKNKVKISAFPSANKLSSFKEINIENISKKKICLRQNDFEAYFKEKLKSHKVKEYNLFQDIKSTKKEEDSHNQTVKYRNILDELSSSKRSTKSNFSMKNLNSYSKKTHRAKFHSNQSARFSPKKYNLGND